ncbi:MAG: ribosome assembly cofactor RimP [Bacteroidetes bacterium]|nr:ribosome assembly cofactor RimP [Bacteroidota bacterium]MBU1577804.1 ribosome assembly cofactor RimP [Bacteroidota bacterium]MBU2466304.1 ribosome assembly cofactor RimP [Bacteroidota bacterium]MBU2559134.1 ribosome assembly cofactor RimP [Bacteroidota bacterium]
MIRKEEIIQLAEDLLEGTDRFVVDVLVKPDNRIMIFMDADSAVTIDHCVELSRYIEQNLDRDEEDFELRVSSAGLDQPLQLLRQYKKAIGRKVSVKTAEDEIKKGVLIAADEKEIQIEERIVKQYNKLKKEVKGDTFTIPLDQIEEIKEVIDFH